MSAFPPGSSGPVWRRRKGSTASSHVWDETLAFLDGHGLLNNVVYVDLLNEYPMFNGFKWLENELKAVRDRELGSIETPEQRKHQAHRRNNMGQLRSARSRPSTGSSRAMPSTDSRPNGPNWTFSSARRVWILCLGRTWILSRFAVLDEHNWFAINGKLSTGTGYWENIHGLAASDLQFPKVAGGLLKNWRTHNQARLALDGGTWPRWPSWAATGEPVGNTEGWGTITWLDHPALTWDIIKEAGEICASLGQKHGYRFNCTSNFTHPQFPRLWNDIAWHKKLTAIIRGTTSAPAVNAGPGTPWANRSGRIAWEDSAELGGGGSPGEGDEPKGAISGSPAEQKSERFVNEECRQHHASASTVSRRLEAAIRRHVCTTLRIAGCKTGLIRGM